MLKCRKVLDKEEEFVKLNEELELETQGLLEQLNHVIQRKEEGTLQGNVTAENVEDMAMSRTEQWLNRSSEKETVNRKANSASTIERTKVEKIEKTPNVLPIPSIGGNLTQPPKLTRHKTEVRIRERLDPTMVPDSVKNMGQDGVLRFLKAKVQILTEQIENVQKDEKKLIDKVKELQADRERVSEDRDKWIQQANAAKNILMKHEQHASDIVMQLQSAQSENGYLKKEVEKLKKEMKQVCQGAGSNEVRLNRANEEVERLKTSLKQMKQEEKDLKEAQKKKLEELTVALKRIEKQKLELLHAFKKQLVVIDGLKKQRGLTEAGKLLKTIEDDFMDFLDWNPNKA